jgi:hypothetical protein
VNLSRVRPGREAGGDIELSKQAANHLIRICAGAEAIELRHHAGQRPFHVVDGIRRISFPLLFETPLAAQKFFTIEVRKGIEDRLSLELRINEEA